jgi:hypothetical protein
MTRSTKSYLISVADGVDVVEPANGKDWTLGELQGLVGGMIEVIYRLPAAKPGMIAVVNEEGLLRGLPFNPVASEMASRSLTGPVVLIPEHTLK